MKKPAYDPYEKKIRKETAEHFRRLCEMEGADTPKEQEMLRINTDYTLTCRILRSCRKRCCGRTGFRKDQCLPDPYG